jgi:predicted metal-dependent HD superfamily phosphohydrolase
MNRYQARFESLWSRCGGPHAQDTYAELSGYYSGPGRYYHTLYHVRRCLRDLDWAQGRIPDADAVELALWCHDVIYVPGARDNEARSADWFLHRADGRIACANDIAAMILDTTHTGVPAALAACYAVDIDLATLGSPGTRFRRNGVLLRAERPDLDDIAYDAAERKYLGRLLARPRLYHTDLFRDRYEARARHNLALRLAQPPPG